MLDTTNEVSDSDEYKRGEVVSDGMSGFNQEAIDPFSKKGYGKFLIYIINLNRFLIQRKEQLNEQ